MCGNIVCVAAVLLGIDAGWQTLPDGGLEYQIQIEPEVIANLDESGVLIQSDVPPQVRDIRSFRITVGKAPLPQEDLPIQAEPFEPAEETTNKPPADPFMPTPSTPAIGPIGPNWLPPFGRAGLGRPDAGQTFPPIETFDSVDTPQAATPQPATVPQEPTLPETMAAPQSLSPDPNIRPLGVEQAVHIQPAEAVPETDSEPSAGNSTEQPKPWLLLTLVLLGLFGSAGLNIYLFWMAAEFRRRYRLLAATMGQVATG